jgi:hypothetical protein
VIEQVLLKEQTQAISATNEVTTNLLDPDRTGDVVVFAAPPYTFNLPYDEVNIIGVTNAGDHGHLTNGEAERFAAFAAAGPNIIPGQSVSPITVLDIAPTVAAALGLSPIPEAEGRVLPILRDVPPVTLQPTVPAPGAVSRPVGGYGEAMSRGAWPASWGVLVAGVAVGLIFVVWIARWIAARRW